MKTVLSICLCALLHEALLTNAAGQESVPAESRHIVFDREIWLKITPPCTLTGTGSKLTVYPQGVTFGDFTKAATFESGIPGYLRGTTTSTIGFNFDLVDRVTISQPMTLRIVRTTMHKTTTGTIVVLPGSVLPEPIRPTRTSSTKKKAPGE